MTTRSEKSELMCNVYRLWALRGSRPGEFGTQTVVDGTTIVRGRTTSRRVKERVVSRRQALGIESHEVRHNRANPSLLVVEHDRCATRRARTKLQRTIGVLSVERLTIQSVEIVHRQISVVEEDYMSAVLPSHTFTDGAVTGVVVDRVVVRMGVNVAAPAGIFV